MDHKAPLTLVRLFGVIGAAFFALGIYLECWQFDWLVDHPFILNMISEVVAFSLAAVAAVLLYNHFLMREEVARLYAPIECDLRQIVGEVRHDLAAPSIERVPISELERRGLEIIPQLRSFAHAHNIANARFEQYLSRYEHALRKPQITYLGAAICIDNLVNFAKAEIRRNLRTGVGDRQMRSRRGGVD